MKKTLLFSAALLLAISAFGQRKMTRAEYIDLYKDIAIDKMETYGIPASITLAQGILESGCGSSDLAIKANNHFGIKCHKGWTGKTFYMDDDEKNECFRRYDDPEESYRDHSLFLTTRERYADLFTLKRTDYKGWAHGLKKAGYATNPQYPQLLIKIIEEENLHQYDTGKGKTTTPKKEQKPTTTTPETPDTPPALPDPDNYMTHVLLEKTPTGRPIYINNSVKYVVVDAGENLYTIAQEFEIYAYQLFKYNDLKKKDRLKMGDVVYLQPKRKKGSQATYQVKSGETLHDVSQKTGVRIKSICKYNSLNVNDVLTAGDVLYLRKP